MKRILTLFLAICIVVICISGCGGSNGNLSTQKTLVDDFRAFCSEELNIQFSDEKDVYYNDYPVYFFSLKKENSSRNPNIVLELWFDNIKEKQISGSEFLYSFLNLSISEQKEFLKHFGELVIKYAKKNGWENDYYLYVKLQCDSFGYIVYDYETKSIYIPKIKDTYQKMYEKFGTYFPSSVKDMPGGKEFLIRNNLAYEKHGELEYSSTYYSRGFDVYINSKGEFVSVGQQDANRY